MKGIGPDSFKPCESAQMTGRSVNPDSYLFDLI
jgi:hypothetical protein